MVARSLFSISVRYLHATSPFRKAAETIATRLSKEVNHLVRERNAAGAVAAVREALCVGPTTASSTRQEDFAFPWPALSATLFACAECGESRLGLSLVEDVRRCFPTVEWADESVLAVTLRLQCAANDAQAARQMFTYLLQSNLLRSRTASLFLQFSCEGGGHQAALGDGSERDFVFAIYEQCLQRGIELGIDDYTSLGRFCVRCGSEPLSTLYFILTEMQEHVAEVSEAFVRDVVEPWCSGHRRVRTQRVSIPSKEEGPSYARQQRQHPSACCPHCNQPLSGYPFTAAHRGQLLSDLVGTVVPRKCRSQKASVGFEVWRRYVTQRRASGDCIDLLIDGANLGYYGLSSWYQVAKRALMLRRGWRECEIKANDLDFGSNCKKSGNGVDVGVSFALINLALELAVSGGEGGPNCPRKIFRRPLVILHERHCEPQNMTEEDAAYVQRWREKGWLYCTPTGLNDDLCWLYAALELTTPTTADSGHSSRRDAEVFVLTNDYMRDHHFTLLHPRSFTRWRDQHQIKFRCAYRKNQKTELSYIWPSPFTRCIQRTLLCDGKQGWHIPFFSEEETEANNGEQREQQLERNSWLCVTEA